MQVEIFHVELEINPRAILLHECIQCIYGMKIAAFIREQGRFLLCRTLAIPNGYLQDPVVTAFVANIVEQMKAVFRVLRDNPKGKSEGKLLVKSDAFAPSQEATQSLS